MLLLLQLNIILKLNGFFFVDLSVPALYDAFHTYIRNVLCVNYMCGMTTKSEFILFGFTSFMRLAPPPSGAVYMMTITQ